MKLQPVLCSNLPVRQQFIDKTKLARILRLYKLESIWRFLLNIKLTPFPPNIHKIIIIYSYDYNYDYYCAIYYCTCQNCFQNSSNQTPGTWHCLSFYQLKGKLVVVKNCVSLYVPQTFASHGCSEQEIKDVIVLVRMDFFMELPQRKGALGYMYTVDLQTISFLLFPLVLWYLFLIKVKREVERRKQLHKRAAERKSIVQQHYNRLHPELLEVKVNLNYWGQLYKSLVNFNYS